MSLLDPVRAAWRRGGTVRGAWVASGSAPVAEVLAGAGFDYVVVDLQHGAAAGPDSTSTLAAIHAQGCVPLVRTLDGDAAQIGRLLDAGALGVIVPSVNSVAAARAAVAACRYPPLGLRSYGPLRATTVFGSTDPAVLGSALCAVMIETVAGLAQVEQIAAVPGIGVIYVGPVDLAIGLGLAPSYEPDAASHRAAITRILDACRAHGVVAGIHCDGGAMAARRTAQGFEMVTVATDLHLVRGGAADELRAAGRVPAGLITRR